MSEQTDKFDIVVIGAGFSGTMVAVNLLKLAKMPLNVCLIERDSHQFGRGIAHSSELDSHLLNVPAANMSAFPDQPDHFLAWAQTRANDTLKPNQVNEVDLKAFLPRRHYGDYLNWTLDQAVACADPQVKLRCVLDKAIDLALQADGQVKIRMAGGESFLAHRVVLALGNFPPGNPPIADPGFYGSQRYFRNPWLPGVLQEVLNTRSCLLIGSGLTMVDWAVSLDQAGYQGTIHVVSRRGLWPLSHRLASPVAFEIDVDRGKLGALSWARQIRRYLRETGGDWRSVIDALRPATQGLWKRLSISQQRRFLRHLRAFWDLHRHRLAPPVAAKLDALIEQQKLLRHVGNVVAYRESEQQVEVAIRLRRSDAIKTLTVEAVVNCSGTESNYRRLESTFVRNLLRSGLICPDPLGLGLMVAENGALIDANGETSRRLFTLGPPKKGMLWETTAVPELRGQAQQLAKLLLEDLSATAIS